MPAIKYIFLGIIQGFSEFLPVSSSAHLVLFQDLLQVEAHQLLLDIALHLGTLLALVVFLFKDIKQLFAGRILLYVVLVTGLTAAIVLLGQDFFEGLFVSPKHLAWPLVITAGFLLASTRGGRMSRCWPELKIADAFWLGIVQGVAVVPGLSRSGVTVSTLLCRGVEKETAFKFSFLASIPAVLGALILKFSDFSQLARPELGQMMFGCAAAFFSGLLALKMLWAVVRRARLYLFGYYCLALALVLWILY